MTVPGYFRGEFQPFVTYQPQEVVVDPLTGIAYQNTTTSPLTGKDPASTPASWTNVGTGFGGGGGGGGALTINAQTGTTYTFVLGDATNTLVELTNAAPVAATIPPDASVAWPAGSVLLIGQGGAGLVTITAGAGVTLRIPNGARTAQQWSQAAATKRAANDWIISGDTIT